MTISAACVRGSLDLQWLYVVGHETKGGKSFVRMHAVFLLSSSRTYGAALRGVTEFCHRLISMNVLFEGLVHRKVSALCSVSMQTGLVRLCAFSQSLRVS